MGGAGGLHSNQAMIDLSHAIPLTVGMRRAGLYLQMQSHAASNLYLSEPPIATTSSGEDALKYLQQSC